MEALGFTGFGHRRTRAEPRIKFEGECVVPTGLPQERVLLNSMRGLGMRARGHSIFQDFNFRKENASRHKGTGIAPRRWPDRPTPTIRPEAVGAGLVKARKRDLANGAERFWGVRVRPFLLLAPEASDRVRLVWIAAHHPAMIAVQALTVRPPRRRRFVQQMRRGSLDGRPSPRRPLENIAQKST